MTRERLKVVVLGAGMVGAYIGGRLMATGADVTLVGRAQAMAELKRTGLTLTDYLGGELRVDGEALQVASDPEALADADLILLTVKSKDSLSAAADISRHARPDAVVLSFQNGVSNLPRLREALPGFKVLAGMVPFNVAKRAEGAFHQGVAGRLFADEDAALAPYLPMFAAAGLPLALHPDMGSVAWAKLLMNLNNAVNAVSGLPLKAQLAQWGYRRSLAAAQMEALALLRQAGMTPAKLGKLPPAMAPYFLSLPDVLFRRLAPAAGIRVDSHARSSMADDLAAGRPTEIDYLNGEVTALADRLGRRAPVNRRMIELVKAAEAGAKPWSAADLYATLRDAR